MLLVCKYAFNVSRPLLIFFTRHYEGDADTEAWSRNVEGEGAGSAGHGAWRGCRRWCSRNRGGLLAQVSAPMVQKITAKKERFGPSEQFPICVLTSAGNIEKTRGIDKLFLVRTLNDVK